MAFNQLPREKPLLGARAIAFGRTLGYYMKLHSVYLWQPVITDYYPLKTQCAPSS